MVKNFSRLSFLKHRLDARSLFGFAPALGRGEKIFKMGIKVKGWERLSELVP